MPIRRPRRPNASLDMTPMIDCVFQLLIFFMLSSSMMLPQIRVTLPDAKTKDEADQPQIVISATAKGELFLNQDPIALQDLGSRLRPLLDKTKNKIVTFRGDKDAHYNVFLQVLDISRQNGADHLNVMHQ